MVSDDVQLVGNYNYFNYFNKKYARISALQAQLNHALMSLLFRCNKVVVPIQL